MNHERSTMNNARLAFIRQRLVEHGAEAVLLGAAPDVRWAVGFTGSNALLAVTAEAAHFVTDGRYAGQARQEVSGAEVHVPGYDLHGHVAEAGLLGPARRVALPAEQVTLADMERLRDLYPGVEWVPVPGFLAEGRGSKEEWEIEAIRRAQALTEEVFDGLLSRIAPGVSERDLAAEIAYQHLRRGADRLAFDPIVASGRRSALPHGRASAKTIRPREFVVIDMGCMLDGYASDMTRTVAVGEPEVGMRRAYEAVLAAQEAGIAAVRAGAAGRDVDRAAREVLVEAGLGEYFSHGLGHGVGLEVHEFPRVSYHADHVLPENTVVTIEPGVYLPERFGVRIEDLVVARRDGPENLTRTPKVLLVL
jgi:Xaa-Pro aminopeptidase